MAEETVSNENPTGPIVPNKHESFRTHGGKYNVNANKYSTKMYEAIYNNDYENFKKISDETPYESSDERDKRDKLHFIGRAINTTINNNFNIDVDDTLKNLDIDKNAHLTSQDYILNRLEKIHSTYEIDDLNDPNNETKKKNIKALWAILTYSTDDPKFKESNFIKFSKYFQPFLRKIMGDYKSIDEAIGKTEKDKFIEKYLDKTIAERYKSAKQGMSSVKDKFGSFFGKKTEAASAQVTTDAASAPTGEAPVTTGEAPKKKWGFFGGKRHSKKKSQHKSRKQGKSRKQRKTRK